ncbi:hypothetical protein L873DRAFT_970312 [Choiromyces venosus 120613-1]|uniref:Uncharacterized protein n=1 Tax=Choiromyces venosus 120613-1 TaxID=1336337 RepID=A0A3N4JSA9_9PEZI|nr:hypothetical protein L873DRAFT_970312 [Choiromyces venosus 120613-1]
MLFENATKSHPLSSDHQRIHYQYLYSSFGTVIQDENPVSRTIGIASRQAMTTTTTVDESPKIRRCKSQDSLAVELSFPTSPGSTRKSFISNFPGTKLAPLLPRRVLVKVIDLDSVSFSFNYLIVRCCWRKFGCLARSLPNHHLPTQSSIRRTLDKSVKLLLIHHPSLGTFFCLVH